MKKILLLLLCSILFTLPLTACANKYDNESIYHTVDIYVTYLTTHKVQSLQIKDGDVIGDAITFSRKHELVWYTTLNGNIEWNLYADEVKCDMSLYGRR